MATGEREHVPELYGVGWVLMLVGLGATLAILIQAGGAALVLDELSGLPKRCARTDDAANRLGSLAGRLSADDMRGRRSPVVEAVGDLEPLCGVARASDWLAQPGARAARHLRRHPGPSRRSFPQEPDDRGVPDRLDRDSSGAGVPAGRVRQPVARQLDGSHAARYVDGVGRFEFARPRRTWIGSRAATPICSARATGPRSIGRCWSG